MLTIRFTTATGKTAQAEVPSAYAPALRSAIKEMRNELGGRASAAHKYAKEDAIVRALSAISAFGAALSEVIPTEDKDYG